MPSPNSALSSIIPSRLRDVLFNPLLGGSTAASINSGKLDEALHQAVNDNVISRISTQTARRNQIFSASNISKELPAASRYGRARFSQSAIPAALHTHCPSSTVPTVPPARPTSNDHGIKQHIGFDEDPDAHINANRASSGKARSHHESLSNFSSIPTKKPILAASDSNHSIKVRLRVSKHASRNDDREHTRKREGQQQRVKTSRHAAVASDEDNLGDSDPPKKTNKRKRRTIDRRSEAKSHAADRAKRRRMKDSGSEADVNIPSHMKPPLVQLDRKSSRKLSISPFDDEEDEILDGSDGEDVDDERSRSRPQQAQKNDRSGLPPKKMSAFKLSSSLKQSSRKKKPSPPTKILPQVKSPPGKALADKEDKPKMKGSSTGVTEKGIMRETPRDTKRPVKRGGKRVTNDDLRVLTGSRAGKVKLVELDSEMLAKKEKMARDSAVKRSQMLTSQAQAEGMVVISPVQCVIAFAEGPATWSKVALNDKRVFSRERFTLAIVPGCEAFRAVNLILYLQKLGNAHVKMLDSSVKSKLALLSFDQMTCSIDDEKWKQKAKSCLIEGLPEKFEKSFNTEPIPPFIEKTENVIQLVYRIFQRFVNSDDDSSEKFFSEWYGRSLSNVMGRLLLKILIIWDELEPESKEKVGQGNVLDWGLRLASKIFLFEIRQPSIFPANVESDSLLLHLFTDEHFMSLPKMIDLGFSYLSTVKGLRSECGTAFIELVCSYFTSLFYVHHKTKAVEKIWEKVVVGDYANELVDKEVFWTTVVQNPLLYVLRSERKVHELHSEIAFSLALLRHPKTCRCIFTSQPKAKENILDLALRALKEISRDPVSVFLDIWEYKLDFRERVTSLDLIKILLTYGFSQRELMCTSDARRNEFLDVVRELITNSGRLAWEPIGIDCVEMWWRRGPFGKTVETLQSDSDPVKIVKSANERMARRYAFSNVAWLVGSLGVSIEDGSREISKANAINSILQRVTSARCAKQFLEELLLIQHHLERVLMVPERRPNASAGETFKTVPKKSVEVFSYEDRNNFARVVEAVRIRVCELKNASTIPEARRRATVTSTSAAPKPVQNVLEFPDITSLPLIQAAVVSEKGYIDRDNDLGVMRSMANMLRDIGQQTLAIYDPDTEFTMRWVRLPRKNAYVGNAKDYLTSEDKAVGQMCSCLPGMVKDDDDGSKKVGCANESCENRMLKVECGPGPCGAGEYCQNRRLQNLEYAKTKKSRMEGKGIGLIATDDIKEGALIGEYQGEVISSEEFSERKKAYAGERHFYFMTLTRNLIIDASRKSQATRYVNHSCDPNAVADKWNAGGEPRVAIIAKRDIRKGEEICFDYGAIAVGESSATCFCGAAKCRGIIAKKEEKSDEATSTSQTHSLPAEEADGKADDLSSEVLDKIVHDKISKAKKQIQWSDDTKKALMDKPNSLDLIMRKDDSGKDILFLNDEKQQKLKAFKDTLPKKVEPAVTTTEVKMEKPKVGPRSVPADVFRIPRLDPTSNKTGSGRNILETLTAKHPFNPLQVDSKKTSGQKTSAGSSLFLGLKKSDSRSYVNHALSQPESGKSKAIINSRPIVRGYVAGIAPPLVDRRKEREHVGPLAGVQGEKKKSVFAPSKSKFQEALKKRRPRVQPKKKTYRFCPEGENDSMADYSTASEVSECPSDYEVPPYYHSSWIQDKEAESDDEFEPAMPVGSSTRERRDEERKLREGQVHREPVQRNPRARYSMPGHETRAMEQFRLVSDSRNLSLNRPNEPIARKPVLGQAVSHEVHRSNYTAPPPPNPVHAPTWLHQAPQPNASRFGFTHNAPISGCINAGMKGSANDSGFRRNEHINVGKPQPERMVVQPLQESGETRGHDAEGNCVEHGKEMQKSVCLDTVKGTGETIQLALKEKNITGDVFENSTGNHINQTIGGDPNDVRNQDVDRGPQQDRVFQADGRNGPAQAGCGERLQESVPSWINQTSAASKGDHTNDRMQSESNVQLKHEMARALPSGDKDIQRDDNRAGVSYTAHDPPGTRENTKGGMGRSPQNGYQRGNNDHSNWHERDGPRNWSNRWRNNGPSLNHELGRKLGSEGLPRVEQGGRGLIPEHSQSRSHDIGGYVSRTHNDVASNSSADYRPVGQGFNDIHGAWRRRGEGMRRTVDGEKRSSVGDVIEGEPSSGVRTGLGREGLRRNDGAQYTEGSASYIGAKGNVSHGSDHSGRGPRRRDGRSRFDHARTVSDSLYQDGRPDEHGGGNRAIGRSFVPGKNSGFHGEGHRRSLDGMRNRFRDDGPRRRRRSMERLGETHEQGLERVGDNPVGASKAPIDGADVRAPSHKDLRHLLSK